MDPSDSSLIKKRVQVMEKMKSSMAIVGHTLGFSILIKGVAHMFWNLSSVHFLKSHNSETKLMNYLIIVLGPKEGQISNSPEVPFSKAVI